jgi:HD-like signal output (HDOD) protein/dsDNA-binding SOS-regulon protein
MISFYTIGDGEVKQMNTDKQPVEELRRFTPLADLSYDKLLEIAETAQWLKAKKRSVLMELEDAESSTLFLIKGNVLMEAADGRQRVIKHTDASARSPLSRLRPSRYRVSALTPVQYLKISDDLLDELSELEDSSEMISSHYLVEETSEENADFSTQMVAHIYEDLQKQRLLLFSWQPAALGISQNIISNNDTSQLSSWISLDPVLSLKLIKSAQYLQRPGSSIPNLASAVAQMSTLRIQKLTFLNLFQESRSPKAATLHKLFLHNWERSITVSAVAKRLAQELELIVDPHEAALAGLLHNIGETTILSYAYNYYRETSTQELADCSLMFGKEIGRMLLSHWNVFHSLAQSICDATEWMHDHGGSRPRLADFVIAARACVQIDHKDDINPPPPFPQIPALKKLRLDTPNSILAGELRTFADEYLNETRQNLGIQPAD